MVAGAVDDPFMLRAQEIRVHPSLPPFEFRLFGGDDGTVYRIEQRVPGEPPVNLAWLQRDGQRPPGGTTPALAVEDLDFDGYLDLLLVTWWGATGNTGYAVWIYDPDSGSFVPNRELWGQSNLTARPEQEVVTTFFRGGHAGAIHVASAFRWIDGEAVVVCAVEQDWLPQRQVYRRTVLRRMEDRLEEVESIEWSGREPEDREECPREAPRVWHGSRPR